jgi:pimeloyl-ACP methyl ester carboxylesterase
MMDSEEAPTGRLTYRRPGLVCTDSTLAVPLDHGRPDGPQIAVFAREVVAADKEDADQPWLLWLQGGPGGKAERPITTSGWLKRALQDYRVLLLDQRGTGRSTPANRQTLARLGSPEAQAAYLTHFRADAIVQDAELLRRHLLGDGGRWSILGQSFGGFCALTYLSFAPDGLREVLVAGGLPPLEVGPDDVYRATYPRVLRKNAAYFARYPGDQRLARRVVEHLRAHDVCLPSGERLTPRRFQTLGITFGGALKFDTLHYLLEEAFVDGPRGPELSDTFLLGVQDVVSYAPRPLYAALHEPIYCQGAASNWSAERVRAEFPQFDLETDQPIRFVGEMIYPWFFEEDPALVPLRAAAELLARYDDWPALYDREQLARNRVPCAAAVYFDDMFVDRDHALQTAEAVTGLRYWVTSEYEHDGIRADPDVLDRLIAMARGRA